MITNAEIKNDIGSAMKHPAWQKQQLLHRAKICPYAGIFNVLNPYTIQTFLRWGEYRQSQNSVEELIKKLIKD